MAHQEFIASGVTRCPTTQVGTALADHEIVAFDKTGVQGAGILGMQECLLQFSLGAKKESAIDANYTIPPAFLDHLAKNAYTGQQSLHGPLIHLESIGGEQEAVLNAAAL
jgi:hypothetical protein